MTTDNGAYREIPFSPYGWNLRYLTWAIEHKGSPSFARGSVVLFTEVLPGPPPIFRMIWIEPAQ